MFDYSIPVLERIKLPILWERLPCGVRIEDLHEKSYDDVEQHIREHYIVEDPMLKACDLSKDPDSVDHYIELVHHWMRDTQSFIAIEEGSAKVVGVLIGRAIDKNTHLKTMSRISIYEGETLQKIQRFRMHLSKEVDVFDIYNIPAYFRIYIWSVEPNFQGKGIGEALLRTSIKQTKLFKMKALMGIFTGAVSQNIVSKFGFQAHLEVMYSQWVEDNEVVFGDPGPGNYSAKVMVLKIDIPEDTTKD
uniref:N-acetyltransferase domain-containing protein n=1 Tax=Clastoptera arizonana TaxID=38151 RepID=A0A1B6DL02_9HEMI